MTERIVLATLPNEPGTAVLKLGRLPDYVRSFVTTRAHVVIAAALPALLLSLMWLIGTGRAGIGEGSGLDYQVYRWAVHTWLSGGDIMHNAPTTSIGITLPWVYPPFALLPLLPLSVLPFTAGLVALFAINLAVLCAVLYLTIRRVMPSLDARAALAVASAILPFTLLLEPVSASFGLGQVNIALMGLVGIDCLARNPRWPRGLLVGIAAAIKLTPAAFLLFFLVRKDYRAAVTTVLTAGASTAVGFLLNFEASLDYWFRSGPAQGVSGSAFHTNQSIMGGMARLEVTGASRTVLWVLLAGALVLVTVRILRRVDVPLGVVTTGLLGLLVSPTSWSDHWVWVVPGLFVMYWYALSRRSWGWLAVAIGTNLLVLGAPFRSLAGLDRMALTAWQQFLGATYLLAGIALLLLLYREISRQDSRQQDTLGDTPDEFEMARSR